jgi:hypothetical protein
MFCCERAEQPEVGPCNSSSLLKYAVHLNSYFAENTLHPHYGLQITVG